MAVLNIALAWLAFECERNENIGSHHAIDWALDDKACPTASSVLHTTIQKWRPMTHAQVKTKSKMPTFNVHQRLILSKYQLTMCGREEALPAGKQALPAGKQGEGTLMTTSASLASFAI